MRYRLAAWQATGRIRDGSGAGRPWSKESVMKHASHYRLVGAAGWRLTFLADHGKIVKWWLWKEVPE